MNSFFQFPIFNFLFNKIKNNKFFKFFYRNLPFINRKTIISVLFFYFLVMLFFTILIMSPLSWNKEQYSWNFLDSLFITTSAFTTTGFSVRNIGVDMTIFGQVLVFFLIIIGGLGLLFFKLVLVKFLFLLFRIDGKTTIYDEQQMFERGYSSQIKTKKMMIVSFSILFIIQIIGFFMFFFYFYFYEIKTFNNEYLKYAMNGNIGKSIWNAAFYSISATNNAGFDLLPDTGSLEMFANEYFVQILFILLFIMGGIGFPVFLAIWESIVRFRKRYFKKQITTNPTKFLIRFLLFSYFFVLVISLCSVFISEFFTSKKTGSDFFMTVLFNTLSTRSAGFSTVDLKIEFNIVSKFLFSLYMWIGSSPLSTGGGIKTTTIIILLISIYANRDKQNNLIIRRRSISSKVVNIAFKTFFLSIFFVFVAIIVISISLYSEINHSLNKKGTVYFSDIFFFAISSFGNVGLNTLNILDKSKWVGFKLISIFLMIMGQIGLVNFIQYKADRINTNTINIPINIPL